MAENKIRKIKLSNDNVYSIFDAGALRLGENNVLLTDNSVVDQVILEGQFEAEQIRIVEIDDIPVAESNIDVICHDKATGELKRENIKQVLRDLGCITANVNNEILNLETITL